MGNSFVVYLIFKFETGVQGKSFDIYVLSVFQLFVKKTAANFQFKRCPLQQ